MQLFNKKLSPEYMINRFIPLLTLAFTFTVFFIAACSPESSSEELESVEKKLQEIRQNEQRLMDLIQNNPQSPEFNVRAIRLVEDYRIFADRYSDHEEAPEMLFRAANLRADGLNEYNKAISMFRRLINEFPESDHAMRSLFLIAYTQGELIGDHDAARKTYQEFLNRFPESDLAESATQMLEFTGRDLESIINQQLD